MGSPCRHPDAAGGAPAAEAVGVLEWVAAVGLGAAVARVWIFERVAGSWAAFDLGMRSPGAEKSAVEGQAVRCQDASGHDSPGRQRIVESERGHGFEEKLNLAERLVSGLAEEKERWTRSVGALQDLQLKLIGNCLISSAFVGYISPFSAVFREDLWKNSWTK
ncbi:unnamed protein product, partial [Prorocentrum cordatum]